MALRWRFECGSGGTELTVAARFQGPSERSGTIAQSARVARGGMGEMARSRAGSQFHTVYPRVSYA